MDKQIIKVASMPGINTTYSQAIKAGSLLFLSGQIALDYATGRLAGDDVRDQTHRTLENIHAVLQSAGSSLDQVVSVTAYLADWDDWEAFNGVYGEFFPTNGPAKTVVQVMRLALGALVEIQVVALVGE
jgi:2-iminobutanoate/2-iminopropanoate deaminase